MDNQIINGDCLNELIKGTCNHYYNKLSLNSFSNIIYRLSLR